MRNNKLSPILKKKKKRRESVSVLIILNALQIQKADGTLWGKELVTDMNRKFVHNNQKNKPNQNKKNRNELIYLSAYTLF